MPKPFLTYEQQLIKLRDEKHIVIADEAETLCKLQQVGYYSLVSGYKHLFRLPVDNFLKSTTHISEEELLHAMGFPVNWKKISIYRI